MIATSTTSLGLTRSVVVQSQWFLQLLDLYVSLQFLRAIKPFKFEPTLMSTLDKLGLTHLRLQIVQGLISLQHDIKFFDFGSIVTATIDEYAYLDVFTLPVNLVLQTSLAKVVLATRTIVVDRVAIKGQAADLTDKQFTQIIG